MQGSFGDEMISFDTYCFARVLLELLSGKCGLSATIATRRETMFDTIAWASIDQNNAQLELSIADPSLVIHEHLSPELIESARPETLGMMERFSRVTHRALLTNLLMDSLIYGMKEDYQNRLKLVIQSFSELMDATRNVTVQTIAESGVNERVYKARLQRIYISNNSDEMLISVRQYHSEDMEELYLWQSQPSVLGRFLHPNLLKFLGYFLREKELFLVNEFAQNGTLEHHLFKSSDARPLSLEIRLKIMIGAARGLEILHVINGQSFYEKFDSSDILLDYDYNGKLLGFMSKEGDVEAFGIVLFEVLTGLSAKGYYIKGSGAPRFVEFIVSRLSKTGHVESIMDSRFEERYNVKTAAELVALALLCTVPDPRARPSISEVLKKLEHIESGLEKQKHKGKTQEEDSGPGGSANNCSLRSTFNMA
ncbi:OLC1v1008529C1 [Oldenlandia corymbosa var. corymbosa]|uniref:OLC1v1008529C1 n=1 Tax=Oldenlandia corymbosa var. corymbosa TaxID=529605 RepID=A0AAV1DLT1_OLDCO|nr:OLC1v1008529C1 [Oldenlandia corymbosa var. corymbosa]